MRQTITFDEVAIRGEKSVKCSAGCGRRLKRSRKFWQTFSPFNKNSLGKIKGKAEIQRELIVERDKWITEPEKCSHC